MPRAGLGSDLTEALAAHGLLPKLVEDGRLPPFVMQLTEDTAGGRLNEKEARRPLLH